MSAEDNHPATSNKRVLSTWTLAALVVGNVIGSGIFLVPTTLARFGSISILAWCATAVGAIFLALVFANLSRMMPKTGGPYAYCRAGFGDFIGFEIAYNYWLTLWIGNAAIAVAMVGYLSVFWPQLTHNHVLDFWIEAAGIWLFAVVNIIGVREAGFVQVVTTVLKLIPLMAIAIFGIFFIHPHHLTAFNVSGHSNFSALTGAAAVTLWTFLGIESATVPAGAAKTPKKSIARATIFGTLFAAGLYILGIIVVMGVIPMTQLAHSNAPFAEAAQLIFGNWAGDLVALGAIISCAGALNGWTLLTGQVPMAAARDKLFPKGFAYQNRKGSPVFGLIASAILVTILLALQLNQTLVNQFTFVILLATFAALIPYIFTSMAQLMLFIKSPELVDGGSVLKPCIIAILAFIYLFWAIIGTGQQIVYYGTLLFMSGIPIYVWMKWRDRDQKTEPRRQKSEGNSQKIVT